MTADVIVCGAGLGGLTAAVALGRAGWRVLLLEQQPTPAQIHKGELLQPRSIQILDRLGVLPALVPASVPARRLVCLDPAGRPSVALDYHALSTPYNYLLTSYYPSIQAAVEQTLPATVEVRRGTRVTGLVEDADGRIVGVRTSSGGETGEVRAALVVAGDGLSSSLRAAAGLDVVKEQYPHRLLAFDLAAPDGRQPFGERPGDVCAYLTPRGLRLVYTMPGGRIRIYVQTGLDEYRRVGRSGLPAWAAGVLDGVPGIAGLRGPLLAGLDSAQPLAAWRYLATSWWRPGLALLGDAAHGVHPMAAQGMNAAIADVWTLARSVGTAVTDPPRLDAALAAYDRAGRERMAYTLRMSHSLSTLFTDTSWRVGTPARWLAGGARATPGCSSCSHTTSRG